MNVLDSNILIYSGQPEYAYLRSLIFDTNSSISKITQLEVLGFHRLNDQDKQYFTSCFQVLNLIPIDTTTIDCAITLRQQRKMTLGDAIIGATALCNNATLITRNISDFSWITNLQLINPIHDDFEKT